MKKALFSIVCGVLVLWLSAGCGGAIERESASIPPMQPAGGELPTAQATDSGTLPSPEAVPSDPVPTEAAPVTPDPTEAVPSHYLHGSDSTVNLIYQNPELPNGCEVTSLAILLDWAGYPIDKVELSDHWLPKQGFYRSDEVLHGADPNAAYAGDPSSPSSGWYCFEGPILAAGNAYLSDQNSDLYAASLSGLTQEELEFWMDAGIPMAVWVTLDYSAPKTRASSSWRLPDGTEYVPYRNLHCVVLAGWDGEDYRIANPIDGWQTVSPDAFWSCFDAMGRRAVAVLPAY